MPLQQGQYVGPYRIMEQLGQGGMATVYRAHHDRLDRDVALKMMHQSLLDDPTFKVRFEREAQIVGKLEHPNIVPVYDFNEHEGQPYLIMKQIEGRTLKSVMSDSPLPSDEILRIMSVMARALDHAHGRGVLHRDIKPSNIILDSTDTPFLTDFGLARMAQAGSSTMSADMMLGTPHYISPEQAQGERDLDARTDIYSFGIVLYEMVVGRVPFDAGSPYAIVHDHIYKPVPNPTDINPNITPQVEAVLLKALAKERADRFNTTVELMEAYRKALEGVESVPVMPKAERPAAAVPAVPAPIETTAPDEAQPVDTRPLIELRMPGDGQPRYVSIPTPGNISPLPDASMGEIMKNVGMRFKEVAQQLQGELEKNDSVRQWTSEIKKQVESAAAHAANAGTPVHHTVPAQKIVDEEWGMDEGAVRRRVNARIKRRNGIVSHTVTYLVIISILSLTWGQLQPFLIDLVREEYALATDLVASLQLPLIIALAWGSGLVNHFITFLSQTSGRVESRRRAVFNHMGHIYGDDWRQDASAKQYKRVRGAVENRFKKRVDFFRHFVSYLMMTLLFAVIWGTALPGINTILAAEAPDAMWVTSVPMPLVFAFFWGIGLVFNGVGVLFSPFIGDEAQERALEREFERERQRTEPSIALEKRKNEIGSLAETPVEPSPVRLTAEGELTDSFAQDWEAQDKRQYGEQ